MATATAHIEQWRLEAWVCDELLEHESLLVEEHLEQCHACARRLDEIMPASDSFVDKLRAGFGVSANGPQAVGADGGVTLDANLMFGVLAVQAGAIKREHLLDACMVWASRTDASLAEILMQNGWLKESDEPLVQKLVDRRTKSQNAASRRLLQKASGTDLTARDGTVILSAVADLQDRQQLRLKELHSTGGIGQVWRARDEVLGRELAIKELLPELVHSSANRERFYREAQITAQLSHPGTVPVHDYCEDEGRVYYTMKFMRGKLLTEAIRDCHALQGAEHFRALIDLLDNFVSICNTIAYAHSRKVIHRDLKGDNVVLGDFGEVTVLDWGLAKKLATSEKPSKRKESQSDFRSSPTLQGELLGTPAFMAPEQARGDIGELDFRTDVYGLAAILYEILSGHVPFRGDTVHELLHRVEVESPQPPSTYNPLVPARLETICLRGLAKSKDARQQSATELRDAVRSWIIHQEEREQSDQSRERFFALSHDLLAILDHQGRIEHVNPAWEEITGRTPHSLIGRQPAELLHPADRDLEKWEYQNLKSATRALHSEARLVCDDGSYKWILWNLVPIPGERKVYAVGRDITELRSKEAIQRDVIRLASVPLIGVGADDKICLVNQQAEQLFGYSESQLLNQPLVSILPNYSVAVGTQQVSGVNQQQQRVALQVRAAAKETPGEIRYVLTVTQKAD